MQVRIDPEAIYDDDGIFGALEISRGALSRARKAGLLRFSISTGRNLYLGQWIIDWIKVCAIPGPREEK